MKTHPQRKSGGPSPATPETTLRDQGSSSGVTAQPQELDWLLAKLLAEYFLRNFKEGD